MVLCGVQDRPSIRYIRDVLRMRSSPLIELRFTGPSAELLTAMEAAGEPGLASHYCYVCTSLYNLSPNGKKAVREERNLKYGSACH